MNKTSPPREQAAREVWQMMASLVLDNQRRRDVSDQIGLSFGKIRALRRIARQPMPMGELAGLLGVDPPNLTSVIDDLEQAGLVERQSHATDRRVKLVAATPVGGALAARAQEILDRPPAALSGLSADELERLRQLLSQLTRARKPSQQSARPADYA